VVIIGNEPEALLLSVLHAEAGIPNTIVGQFRDWDQARVHRSGIEEALWLFQIHKRARRIHHQTDLAKLEVSRTQTLMITSNHGTPNDDDSLAKTLRIIAPQLSTGTQVALVGLCKPRFVAESVRATLEKHSGLKVGQELGLSYLPVHWTGERVNEFQERPEILATLGDPLSDGFQPHILRIFPALTKASKIEYAEAAGLFSTLSKEVTHALRLDLAQTSNTMGLAFDEISRLCSKLGASLGEDYCSLTGRESIGATIALNGTTRRNDLRLIRVAQRVNEDYQTQILEMIKGAVNQCGQRLRRSRITILGTEGLVKNSWARPEAPSIMQTLRRKGARVTLYPGQVGLDSWTKILDGSGQVETNLWRAVSNATCTIVALPKGAAEELDTTLLAREMNRPGVVCDLSRVLEASNVERAGLFYTSIGRGIPTS